MELKQAELDYYFEVIEDHYEHKNFDYQIEDEKVKYIHVIKIPESKIVLSRFQQFLESAEWHYVIDGYYATDYQGYDLSIVNGVVNIRVNCELTDSALDAFWIDNKLDNRWII